MNASTTIGRYERRGLVRTIRPAEAEGSGRHAATIVAAFVIQLILILGVVAANLGLGSEAKSGVGPDRPAPPSVPAPGPAPDASTNLAAHA